MRAKSFRPRKRLKLFQGPVFVAPPIVCGSRIWVGATRQQIVSVVPGSWTPEHSVDSEGFQLESCEQDVLLGKSADRSCRVFDVSGDVLWTERTEWGWLPHNTEVVTLGPSVRILDVRTGMEKRRFAIENARPEASAVVGSILLILQDGVTLQAFDLESGLRRWAVDPLDSPGATRVQDRRFFGLTPGEDAHFVVTFPESIVGCSMKDGLAQWEVPITVAHYRPSNYDGMLYGWTSFDPTSKNGPELFAINASGGIEYRRAFPEFAAGMAGMAGMDPMPPTVDSRHIAITTRFGLLAVFDRLTGDLIAHHQIRAGLSSALLTSDSILVGSELGELIVFDRP